MISLAHGQSITITGLPEGARYSVTEKDVSVEGYTVSSTGESVATVGGAVQTASFTNTLNVADADMADQDADPSRDTGAGAGASGAAGGESKRIGSGGDEHAGIAKVMKTPATGQGEQAAGMTGIRQIRNPAC